MIKRQTTPAAEGWRLKEVASRLRVLDPQMLAATPYGGGPERYTVSGWPARLAGEQFERMWERAA